MIHFFYVYCLQNCSIVMYDALVLKAFRQFVRAYNSTIKTEALLALFFNIISDNKNLLQTNMGYCLFYVFVFLDFMILHCNDKYNTCI